MLTNAILSIVQADKVSMLPLQLIVLPPSAQNQLMQV